MDSIIIPRHHIVSLDLKIGCVFDQALSYGEIILCYRVTDGEDIQRAVTWTVWLRRGRLRRGQIKHETAAGT